MFARCNFSKALLINFCFLKKTYFYKKAIIMLYINDFDIKLYAISKFRKKKTCYIWKMFFSEKYLMIELFIALFRCFFYTSFRI